MARKTAQDVFNLLEGELPGIRSDIATLTVEMSLTKEVAQQNNRALRGSNSNPGLVAKVSSLCSSQDVMSGRVEKIEVTLHEGADGVPGLVDQVRENREWRKSLKRWYIVFVGAIIVGVINVALELWSRYFFIKP